MNFLEMEIRNFLTIGEARLELDNRGLLLIQGCNEDDTSAKSNGAGKSSVVDALCWALYGTTARGVTGTAVVNRSVGKNCSVRVVLQDDPADDFNYVVTRHRLDVRGQNRLKLEKHRFGGGAGEAKITDLTKGTERETQNVVTRLVGCGLDVFLAAVYAGQERMPDLPGMTDSVLKVLIEEAAGLEVLTQAHEVARHRHHVVTIRAETASRAQDISRVVAAELETTLGELEARSAVFEAGRRERAKAELVRVPALGAALDAAKGELAGLAPRDALARELDGVSARIAGFDDERKKFDALDRLAVECDRDAAAARASLLHVREAALCAREALRTVDEQVGKPCRECGRIYGRDDLAAARRERESALGKQVENLKTCHAALRAAEARAKTAHDRAESFAATMTDMTTVARRQHELTMLLHRVDETARKIAEMTRDIGNAKAAASARLVETNPWTDTVQMKRALLRDTRKNIETASVKVEELARDVETHAMATKVFGPAGVRAHILDTVTPFLNERTDEYLGVLADGGIHARWTTLTKTAKGDLREKFGIEVSNDRAASFAGLSGGEKRKVRVACTLALQDLVASRATKPIRLFIADEIDHALDDAGLERLMGVLERKAREHGTVLIISHNALGAYVPNVITVTKRGGLATLDGATGRGASA